MGENKRDSTSSEDDETDIDAFREACDERFLPESLFTSKKSSKTDSACEKKEETRPSLRVTERVDNFESFGVSQTFKDYVAKKLDAILERSIDENELGSINDIPKKKRKKYKNKEANGIKLLSSSIETITNIQDEVVQKYVAKTRECKSESDYTNKNKCREVVVNADQILSKAETKAWSKKCKGPVYKYKKDHNGVLIEQV